MSGRSGHADERVELRDAVADALPVGDGEADAVVFTLVLCSVDQPHAALAEAQPGAAARAASCGSSSTCTPHEPGAARRLQRALDATVWPRLFGGCHLARDTAAAIEEAGFTLTEIEHLSFPEGARDPSTAAAILGRAVPA